jgi:hypothetical protein
MDFGYNDPTTLVRCGIYDQNLYIFEEYYRTERTPEDTINDLKEYKNYDKTVARSSSLTLGSVDSIIIESKGTNYSVGDKLVVDNTLTGGSGFSGFVSKISGKQILGVTHSTQNTDVTIATNSQNNLAIGDYVYFDYEPTTPSAINLHGYLVNGLPVPISPKVKEAKTLEMQRTLDHVDQNREHFENMLQLHHHLQNAKNVLTNALSSSSGDFKTTIGGKKTKPEGFVVVQNNRPTKFVDRQEFSAANFNRPK